MVADNPNVKPPPMMNDGEQRPLAAARCSTASWKTIIAAGNKTVLAYAALVKSSDDLAAVMPYGKEYVLRRVMHQKSDDRRNSKRIMEWLNADREKIERDTKSWQEENKAVAERESLLRKLNLTDEQKRLLGIKEKP